MSGQKTILVVDDINKVCAIVKHILTTAGYKVYVAGGGLEALGVLQNEDVDLILLDIRMPGMSGYDLCEKLKQMEGKKNTPVIFMTALKEEEDVKRAKRLGARGYIVKPFDKETILNKVKEVFGADAAAQKKDEQEGIGDFTSIESE